MLHLLTPTGARPRAWAICERLMAAQDYEGPVSWIIVDDGPEPQPLTFRRPGWEVVIIRPGPLWRPGQNTQRRNLQVGLHCIPLDARLAIIEDDDYYDPGYLTAAIEWLENADLVGENMTRYFNVPNRVPHLSGAPKYACLCATAMKGAALAAFRGICAQDVQYVDIELWRSFRGQRALHTAELVVGMKGLPGRPGITGGHKLNGMARGEKLREWIGAAADLYLPPG